MRRNHSTQKLLAILALTLAWPGAIPTANAEAETLQQAWDAALAANRSLKAARENTASSASSLAAAKSARLPTVWVAAGYTALDNTQALNANMLGQSLQVPMAPDNSASYAAMASIPLYTGGRIQHGIDATAALLEASRQDELSHAQSLKMGVSEAYVTVLRAARMLKVAESHVRSLEAHSHDVEDLFTQGMAVKTDSLSVQVALADARQKALQAANGLDLSRAAYNRLLARPLDQAVELEELTPENNVEAFPILAGRAIAQRSELTAMDSQIEAVRNQAKVVRGENRPQVALSGGYNYQENPYQAHESQWVVKLGARWNLFDGSLISNRADAVERMAAALAEQRAELVSIVSLQVRQAWLDIEETHRRIEVTQSSIALAEENLQVVRDRYKNGFSSHTEVLDAETLRLNSETSYANALYDSVLAGLRLKRATGEL
ncbi:MAG: TolC family protein [Opitutales bacterium]|jgi:outer membrane protein TolC